MAVSRNQFSGFKTSTNVSGGPARQSLTNGTAARKYTAKDNVQNNDVSNHDVRSNAEHIVDHAAGLKTTSMVVAQASAVGLSQLQAIRAQLQGLGSAAGSARPNPTFDDHDLRVQQNGYINDILGKLGKHPVTSIQHRLEDHTQDLIQHSVNNFLPVSLKGDGSSVNSSGADIDHITVDMHLVKGVMDIFYSTVQFTVPKNAVADGSMRAIRIFRATVANPDFFLRTPARLSVTAVERLCAQPLRSKRKNQDYLGQYERQLSDMDIDNALSALNPTDPLRKLRLQASDERVTATDHLSAVDKQPGDGVMEAHLSSFIDPTSFQSLDRSVAIDLQSLKNLQHQNPHLAIRKPPTGVNVGSAAIISNAGRMGKEALRQNRTNFGQSSQFIIDRANKLEFKEIAFIAPDKLNGRLIGDRVEYTFEDYTIHYAKSYRYYIVTVDENMAESTRSRIVQINVDGLRVPQSPTRATGYTLGNAVCLNIQVDDLLVEKFEIYRKQLSGQVSKEGTKKISVLNGSKGYHIGEETRPQMPNGFMQIGEALNKANTGGVFYDRDAKPGHKYVYRAFSVDIFGNKSEAPKEFQVFWPEAQKHVDLSTPHILAEVNSFTGHTKLTFQCEDTRVTRLFLTRRDVSLGQSAFIPPGQVERIKLGLTDHARGQSRFDDVRYGFDPDKQLLWNGIFENHQEHIVFADNAVAAEHTYQYQIVGMDRFGNKTQAVTTPRLFIAIAANVYEPKNLQAIVVPAGSQISGIQVSWQDSNIDIAAEDMVGNQEDLRESSVRTLFQVSRRRIGEDMWFDFPLTSDKTLFDAAQPAVGSIIYQTPAQVSVPPGFAEQSYLRQIGSQQSASIPSQLSPLPQQPPHVIQNETYAYRVQAFQSGNFISNYSTALVVNAAVQVTTPLNFRVKPQDTKARPFYVALNWDTSIDSGVVDRWEIEKAVVNNFAASKLNNLNPSDFDALTYVPFKSVYSESSRFRERSDDDSFQAGLLGGTGAATLLTGQHHYIDQEVDFGNTYFYRIRAVSVAGGQTSDWSYRAMKVTDESFEKKQNAIITADEKVSLSTVPAPLNMKQDFFMSVQHLAATSLTVRSIPALAVASPVPHIATIASMLSFPAPIVLPIRAIPAPLPPATVRTPTVAPKPVASLARLDTAAISKVASKSILSSLASRVFRR